ncbi:unnamed protein product [Caenorhabditis nigoni]
MPVNLLEMPYLVSVMVVTELDYQEIFLLSLSSRRSLALVKKARIQVPKLAFRYDKCDRQEEFVIGVKTNMHEWSYVTSVKHVPELDWEGVLDVKPELEYESIIRSWHKEDGSFRHQIERSNKPREVQKEYQDYINSIFHYSGSYKLILSMKCKGQLPNVTNVEYIEIEDGTIDEQRNGTIDAQFLSNLLTTYPDPHTLSVDVDIVGELPKDSLFFQVQNVAVGSLCGPEYIHNFLGRHLRLDSVTVTDQGIIQFLEKWISNEAYHNLETLVIFVDHPLIINADLIRQTIECEEYNSEEPEKRPEHFVIDAPFDGILTIERYSLRKDNVVEIKRATDGKRAFLRIYPTYLQFIVPQKLP